MQHVGGLALRPSVECPPESLIEAAKCWKKADQRPAVSGQQRRCFHHGQRFQIATQGIYQVIQSLEWHGFALVAAPLDDEERRVLHGFPVLREDIAVDDDVEKAELILEQQEDRPLRRLWPLTNDDKIGTGNGPVMQCSTRVVVTGAIATGCRLPFAPS